MLSDCDDETAPDFPVLPKMSVEECISLYGGGVVGYDEKKGTYPWVLDDGFTEDVLCLWELCREDPGVWNRTLSIIITLVKYYSAPDDPAYVEGSKYYTQKYIESEDKPFADALVLLRRLEGCGYLTDYYEDDDTLRFGFRDTEIKRCLTKEGTILELVGYCLARQAVNPDETPVYNDVRTGVYIDWDGDRDDDHDEKYDTENEIDVILMKGLVPIFVSCKNGWVDQGELYKLNAVANRFGGPYAKKVILVSKSGKVQDCSEKHFVQRTKDMNIRLIENVADLTLREFAQVIKKIGS